MNKGNATVTGNDDFVALMNPGRESEFMQASPAGGNQGAAGLLVPVA